LPYKFCIQGSIPFLLTRKFLFFVFAMNVYKQTNSWWFSKHFSSKWPWKDETKPSSLIMKPMKSLKFPTKRHRKKKRLVLCDEKRKNNRAPKKSRRKKGNWSGKHECIRSKKCSIRVNTEWDNQPHQKLLHSPFYKQGGNLRKCVPQTGQWTREIIQSML